MSVNKDLPLLRPSHRRLLGHRLRPHLRLAHGSKIPHRTRKSHCYGTVASQPDGHYLKKMALGPCVGDGNGHQDIPVVCCCYIYLVRPGLFQTLDVLYVNVWLT